MTSSRKFLAAIFAACFFAVAAFAADASPAGTWKWTPPGRGGNPGVERTLILEVKEGKLMGTLKGFSGGQFEVPDVKIDEAAIKDGTVSFSVTNEFNGNKFTSKYTAKLEGDTLTGSVERPGRDGGMTKTDWVAKRAK
jgi:hypothetical protein